MKTKLFIPLFLFVSFFMTVKAGPVIPEMEPDRLSSEMIHTCYVNPSSTIPYFFFKTIQGAIDSERCQTIYIEPGTYVENLRIGKSVNLLGRTTDSSTVKIDGNKSNAVISLTENKLDITLKNLTLENGDDLAGSAFWGSRVNNMTLENVTIKNNTGSITGAVCMSLQGNLVLDHVTCTENSVSTGAGGCLWVFDGVEMGTVMILDSTFSKNTALAGGALYIDSVKDVVISNSTFENNTVEEFGGAILYYYKPYYESSGAVLTLEDSTCEGNIANTEGGGCLWASGDEGSLDDIFEITNTSFINNQASLSGGGFYSEAMNVSITESTFDSNSSGEQGGGIDIQDFETVSIDTTTFSNNSAPLSGGLSFLGTEINLSNLLFYKNKAIGSHGGAFSSTGSTKIKLTNSTFSKNSAARYGGAIHLGNTDSGNVSLANLTVYKNTAGSSIGKSGEGGGIYVGSGNTVYLERTVFAENEDNTFRGNCENLGKIVSQGYNRDTDATCNFTKATDDTISDAGLEALVDNNGPTYTHMLSSDSVLIDAGGTDCAGTDQRGASWPVDGDSSGTAECDIGAVEYNSTP